MSTTPLRGSSRQYLVALRVLIALTVVSILYTFAITGIGQLILPAQSNGSAVVVGGKTIGSSLIGQSFTTAKGAPIVRWFQSRPSAAGDGYDGGASSASNLGPNNPDLVKAIEERKQQIESLYGVSADQIPADAVTASGSGLDPHISPAYARLQVGAIAEERGLSATAVRALVDKFTQGPDLGYLGQSTVNVLQLNVALATMDPNGNG
ncbi:potassium-transporting ATPase subunit KdpC [uncultured Amnibacterium sp.]|uniref:potassium-transporting ATPase subunit KdpC n=1 Tax=uncultured Amnibacterium sp. TaxID=1631851 RepID=UPI0035C9AB21